MNDRLPVRVVRDEVGLDHPDRAALEQDQIVVGWIEPGNGLLVAGDRFVDRVAPPGADVLPAEPFAEERQVLLAERFEGDHAERIDRSAWSSRTCRIRHAPR